MIPPGLLGYSAGQGREPEKRASSSAEVQPTVSRETVELAALIHPIFFGEYAAFAEELDGRVPRGRVRASRGQPNMAEYVEMRQKADTDLVIGRWGADYPDADTFCSLASSTPRRVPGRYCGDRGASTPSSNGAEPRRIRASATRSTARSRRGSLEKPSCRSSTTRSSCFARPELGGLSLGLANPHRRLRESLGPQIVCQI